jgi:two-component system chemotaxis response regulator CheB
VVFGMPKEAIKLGAAKRILPLSEIPLAILGK